MGRFYADGCSVRLQGGEIYAQIYPSHRHLTDDLRSGIDEKRAKQVAAALNAAEESRDRTWEGSGPTPKEAGGPRILARHPDGFLTSASRHYDREKGRTWIDLRGAILGVDWTPTGWRPMPKVGADLGAAPAETAADRSGAVPSERRGVGKRLAAFGEVLEELQGVISADEIAEICDAIINVVGGPYVTPDGLDARVSRQGVTVEPAPRPETRAAEDAYLLNRFQEALTRCADLLELPGAPDLSTAVPEALERLIQDDADAMEAFATDGIATPRPETMEGIVADRLRDETDARFVALAHTVRDAEGTMVAEAVHEDHVTACAFARRIARALSGVPSPETPKSDARLIGEDLNILSAFVEEQAEHVDGAAVIKAAGAIGRIATLALEMHHSAPASVNGGSVTD